MDERAGARQLVRNHFHRNLHAERFGDPLQFLDAAPRRRARIDHAAADHSEMRHEHRDGDPPRDVQRVLRFFHRMRPRARIRACDRQRLAPASCRIPFADRRVNAPQLQTRLREPLLQVRHGRGVVVVEVRARRKDLDALEPVRRDLQEMIAAQALMVEEVR